MPILHLLSVFSTLLANLIQPILLTLWHVIFKINIGFTMIANDYILGRSFVYVLLIGTCVFCVCVCVCVYACQFLFMYDVQGGLNMTGTICV